MGDESPCIPTWRRSFPSDQQNAICWLEGSSQRWQCVCLLLLELCVCAWEASISGLLWKKWETFGSNDSGSPQHLATALCVCVFIGHGPFECTGVRMGSSCGKYFDHIPKKMINKGTMVDHKNTACSHLISVTTVRDNSDQTLSHSFSVTSPFSGLLYWFFFF